MIFSIPFPTHLETPAAAVQFKTLSQNVTHNNQTALNYYQTNYNKPQLTAQFDIPAKGKDSVKFPTRWLSPSSENNTASKSRKAGFNFISSFPLVDAEQQQSPLRSPNSLSRKHPPNQGSLSWQATYNPVRLPISMAFPAMAPPMLADRMRSANSPSTNSIGETNPRR